MTSYRNDHRHVPNACTMRHPTETTLTPGSAMIRYEGDQLAGLFDGDRAETLRCMLSA